MSSLKSIIINPIFIIYVLLISIFPVVNINSTKLPSALFYLVIFICLIILVVNKLSIVLKVCAEYKLLWISYVVLLLAVISSSLYYGDWPGANGEGAIRFFIASTIAFCAMFYIPKNILRKAVWGFHLAGLVSSFVVLYLAWPDLHRPDTPVHNAVTYGNYLALVSVLCFFSLAWQETKFIKLEKFLKVSVAFLSLFAFAVTQTRSAWVAFPVFIFVATTLYFGRKDLAKSLIASLLIVLSLACVFALNDTAKNRIVNAYEEVVGCQDENRLNPSSICVRFQLWAASWDMFERNPLFGTGDGSLFYDNLVEFAEPKGIVSRFVIDEQFGEPHNDLLFMLASFGIPGFLGLLLIYISPLYYFIPRLIGSYSFEIRTAAAMGLCICCGFFIFGLTELMFRRMHTIGFYAIFVMYFMRLSDTEIKDSNN